MGIPEEEEQCRPAARGDVHGGRVLAEAGRRICIAALQMRSGSDVGGLLVALRDGLDGLGIPIQELSVNLNDAGSYPPRMRTFVVARTGAWRSGWLPERGQQVVEAIRRSGALSYREDLDAVDLHQEREALQQGYGVPIRSLVDVPIAQGTLAVNSTVPRAFTAEHLAFLQEMAQVLSIGLTRLNDFQVMERRSAELATQIAARQRDLDREAAMGRIRDQILALGDMSELDVLLKTDWVDALRHLGLPVWRISVQVPSARAGYYSVHWTENSVRQPDPPADFPLSACPWVAEAWRSNLPVVVAGEALARAGFAAGQAQSLVELPLPGFRGSMGVSSTEASAFGGATVRTLEAFAGLVAVALRRMQDLGALKESEDRYRRLVEHLPVGVTQTTPDGRVLYQNPHARRIWGYAAEDLPQMQAEEFYASGTDYRETMERLADVGHHAYEYPMRTKSGEEFLGQGVATVLCDRHGNVVYQSVVEDVTERRRAEVAANRARQDWEATFDTVPDAITIHDQGFNIVHANRGARELLGLPRSEALRAGKCFAHYHGTASPPPSCASCGCLDTGQPTTVEVFEPFLDKHLEIRAMPRRDPEGRMMGLVHVVRDITQRKRAEEALRVDLALQRIRQQVLQLQGDGDWSVVGHVLFQEAARLIAFDAGGLDLDDGPPPPAIAYCVGAQGLVPGEPSDGLVPLLQIGRAASPRCRGHRSPTEPAPTGADEAADHLVEQVFSGGRLWLTRSAGEPFGDREAAILERFGEAAAEAYRRLQDGRALQRMAETVETQRSRALQADRLQALGELATGIAHEVNQPLNGIRAFAEGARLAPTMGWMPSAEEMMQAFGDIIEQVDKITAIMDHVRGFAHSEEGQEAVTFALTEPVDGALKLVGAQIRGHGIAVHQEHGSELAVCRGWPNAIEQVVLNLLANARDALDDRRERQQAGDATVPPDWQPCITVTAASADDQVRLSVTDNGGGMTPVVAQRAFEPFYTTKPVGKGTGLGLAIVRAICARHGGTIELENRPEEGVTFTVVLPVAGVDSEVARRT